MVNERLGFAAPTHVIMHRAHHRSHGARGINGVAAELEHPRAGYCAERLAGNRHPMLAVKRRTVGLSIEVDRRKNKQPRINTDEHGFKKALIRVHPCLSVVEYLTL